MLARALVQEAVQAAERMGVSSLHWLFTTDGETRLLEDQGHLRRVGCQFHWSNAGYGSFDELLGTFTAEKRKKVKRERRRVEEAGIHIRRVPGDQVRNPSGSASIGSTGTPSTATAVYPP